MKAWRQAHKKRTSAAKRAYRATNPEQYRADNRRYYLRHPERWREALQRLRAENPTKLRAKFWQSTRNRRARMAGAQPSLSPDQWEAIKRAYGYRCAYCGAKKPLTMDHVTPLSKGGLHASSNIVPACRSCNSQKATRAPIKLPPVRLLL